MAQARKTRLERTRDRRPDCVFCRIVAGEAPVSKVFEDARTLAFMDVNPVRRGHVLVIPKAHKAQVWEMRDTDFAAVYREHTRVPCGKPGLKVRMTRLFSSGPLSIDACWSRTIVGP